MRIPIAFSPVNRAVLSVLGLAPRWAYVEVGDGTVKARMAYGFSASIPRSSITHASVVGKIPWGWGIGVHSWGGRWVVNGTLRNVARLDIEPRGRGRVLGVPVKLRTLWVSVVDPQGLVAALAR